MKKGLIILVLSLLSTPMFSIDVFGSKSSESLLSVGDQVHQITVPVPGSPNYCSIGLAFDGQLLYYDRCDDSNIYKIDPISGALQDTFNTEIAELPNALSFDSSRNGIWIGAQRCNSEGMPIYFWNLDNDSVNLRFTIPISLTNPATNEPLLNLCFTDGLAFDVNEPENPDDDEIWFSDDVYRNLGVFTPNGNFLRGYDGQTVDPSLNKTSGIAIGGPFLYMANNGGGDVFRADRNANPLSLVDQFTSGDTRQEGMACDPVTFAPLEVMWVRTTPQGGQFPDVITAYEIETGSCGLGGEPPDSDGDGLFDIWETQGIDQNGDGSIDVDLPAMGADPNKKDLFVEIDWMEQSGLLAHNHQPDSEVIRIVVDAFANAPVDGEQGINLHVDVGPESVDFVTGRQWGNLSRGNSLPHDQTLGDTSSAQSLANEWQQILDNNFGHDRRVFHHAIFAHLISAPGIPTCTSGIGFPQRIIVSLGGYPGCPLNLKGTGSINEQAGTFMHELGHSLGLRHGGEDDIRYKPNYLSVMNYSFQFGGLLIRNDEGKLTDAHFDYSRFDLPDLHEAQLSEPNGLNGGAQIDQYGTKYSINFPNLCIPNDLAGFNIADHANGPIDWNCNNIVGVLADKDTVQADINGEDGSNQILTSFDDWSNLQFEANTIGQSGALPPLLISSEEVASAPTDLTEQEDQQIPRVNEPRVNLSKFVIPQTIHTGGTVTYTIVMSNTDIGVAEEIMITDTLPLGFSYQPGSTNGVTTNDPTIIGQEHVWGPFDLNDSGALTLTFQALTSQSPGIYFNNISGDSKNGIVLSVGDTAPITTVIVPLNSSNVSGPMIGTVNQPYSFVASVNPISASLPITFTWQAEDHSPMIIVGNLSNTMTFTWATLGHKVITVSSANAGGELVATHNISITARSADSIAVVADPTSILANGLSTSTIEALVKDEFGNPVSGQEVEFSTSLGSILSPVTTDSEGIAVTTLTSVPLVDTAIVTAAIGLINGTTQVEFSGSVITGVVFTDINQNGVKDSNEKGISGALVTAEALNSNISKTVTTNENGEYNIPGLPPGDYVVTILPPPGYTLTTDGVFNITLATTPGGSEVPGVGISAFNFLPTIYR